tara:strand:+ start:7279 stop:9411 length:2133 start_codon:yes stop_codon:yes gene_type:complete
MSIGDKPVRADLASLSPELRETALRNEIKSTPKRSPRDMIKKGVLKTSVSQISAADPKDDGCYRKWWFKSVMRLKGPPKTFSTFGDVVHECCERFLLADDFGRDTETGKAVELFPDGWEESTNRWTGEKSGVPIKEGEKFACKSMINTAIEQGILSRMPGREIEKEVKHVICEHEGVKVLLGGFIDLCEPDSVIDHKSSSSKSAKRYYKSPAKLRQNTQLVGYAYCRWEEDEVDKDTRQWLKHNYFSNMQEKGLHVERREVEIGYADAKRFVNDRMIPVIKQMVEYILVCEDYKTIPLPDNPAATCQKYGGCEYQEICTGQCTPKSFKKRMDRLVDKNNKTKYTEIANEIANDNKNKTGESSMAKNLMDKIRNQKNASAAVSGSTPKVEPKVEPKAEPKAVAKTPAPKVEKVTEVAAGAAPWFVAGCGSCKNEAVPGIKNGKICLVCRARSKSAGINVDDYEVVVDEGNTMIIELSSGEMVLEHNLAAVVSHKEVSESTVEAEAKAQAKVEAEEAKAKAEAQAKADADAKELADAIAAQEAEDAEAEAKKIADAQDKADAEIKAQTPAPTTPTTPTEDGTEKLQELEINSDRFKGKILINCAITEGSAGGRGKLGSPAFVITGEQLMNAVKDLLMKTDEIQQFKARKPFTFWEELDSFMRKDLIKMYAPQIAAQVGASTVQVRDIPKSSDMNILINALAPYFQVIEALAK